MQSVDSIKKEIIKKPRKKNVKPPEGSHIIDFPVDTVMEHQWHYNGTPLLEIPDMIIGMVYLITNKLNGKKYVGKKNFFGTKIRSIKKQQYRVRAQSDFITYYGSNDDLKADVALHGPENFHREILVLCDSKSEMSYWEIAYQLHYHVIGSDSWYNHWITCKITSKHLKPHHYKHTIREDL